MKTFDEIRDNLGESSSFAEKVLIYYAMKEKVIIPNSAEAERIGSIMFDALLGKQELNELPGVLNSKGKGVRK
jgi:hypothetical protein